MPNWTFDAHFCSSWTSSGAILSHFKSHLVCLGEASGPKNFKKLNVFQGFWTSEDFCNFGPLVHHVEPSWSILGLFLATESQQENFTVDLGGRNGQTKRPKWGSKAQKCEHLEFQKNTLNNLRYFSRFLGPKASPRASRWLQKRFKMPPKMEPTTNHEIENFHFIFSGLGSHLEPS